MTRPIRHSWYI